MKTDRLDNTYDLVTNRIEQDIFQIPCDGIHDNLGS